MVTLAVQAGGQSRRMGRDKGLVELAGRPLIRHVIDRLARLADEVVVTTNDRQRYAFLDVRLVSDAVPGAGALPGLATALEAAHGERVLIVACDMPFASAKLAAHLLELALDADVAIPRREGEFEPLFAAYRRDCLPAIHTALAAGQARMISYFPSVRVRPVEAKEWESFDPGGRSFFNVNTPDDLRRAEAMWAEERASRLPGDDLQ
ncbi:MAG TPA: molybdenum cofactor guanylyltransferase [Anaerolineales bacterium]|nr:molybdenum cofactor guanylyltransferase [Anaerolineales bacterium]